MQKLKVNQIITEQIINNLQKSGQWVKSWESLENVNLVSKKAYTGINTLLLAMSREQHGYNSNYWLTYNQVLSLADCKSCGKKYQDSATTKKCCNNPDASCHVKQGSKSTMIIFYSQFDIKNTEKELDTLKNKEKAGTTQATFVLRYYRVFNLDQVDGGDELKKPELIGEHNEEKINAYNLAFNYIKREKIEYTSFSNHACYIPSEDAIKMPDLKQFKSSDSYYKTLFHEITHSTGHEKRLDRFDGVTSTEFGSESYSKEELVAELGSLFLSSYAGLDVDIKNSSAYINGWCKALKNDPQLIISASSKAQKAFDIVIK